MSATSLGALLLSLGILFGAFGAHGLEEHVSPERLEAWDTASLYHLINATGLLALGVLQEHAPHRVSKGVLRLLIAGIFLFSGSLYCLVLLDIPWLGAITPIGGLALTGAWAWFAFRDLSSKTTTTPT